jgi:ATP-dependent RNA helicase DHX57
MLQVMHRNLMTRPRYLEDFLSLLSYRPSGRGVKGPSEKDRKVLAEELGGSMDDQCISALYSITRSERVDIEVCYSLSCILTLILMLHQLVTALVIHITASDASPGGILIFLPGVQEIQACINALKGLPNAKILPLHANLSSDEQRAVFAPTSGWKVIAATNVAEVRILWLH